MSQNSISEKLVDGVSAVREAVTGLCWSRVQYIQPSACYHLCKTDLAFWVHMGNKPTDWSVGTSHSLQRKDGECQKCVAPEIASAPVKQQAAAAAAARTSRMRTLLQNNDSLLQFFFFFSYFLDNWPGMYGKTRSLKFDKWLLKYDD